MSFIAAYSGSLRTFESEDIARTHAFSLTACHDKPLVIYEIVERSTVHPLPIIQPPKRYA